MIRLHLNENTAGPSPAVLDAVRGLAAIDLASYAEDERTRGVCAHHLGVEPEWVALTNGLDEGLYAAAYASRLIDSDFEAIVVEPAFEMYAIAVAAAGGRQVTVPPRTDLRFSTEDVLRAVTRHTRVIYLCDPNNPTGLPLPDGAVHRIAEAAPHAIVLVDEAYADYSGRTLIGPGLDRYRNVVVGRTFAKAQGLAALRIGALIAHPDALAPLRRVLPPFNVNVCAMVALEAALQEVDYTRACVEQSRESRELIYAWCSQRRLDYWASEGNFVLIRAGSGVRALVQHVASRGILIRDRSRTPGCSGCIRITANRVDETRLVLQALEAFDAPLGG
jgi:histidinol-phosphate aminotransferase